MEGEDDEMFLPEAMAVAEDHDEDEPPPQRRRWRRVFQRRQVRNAQFRAAQALLPPHPPEEPEAREDRILLAEAAVMDEADVVLAQLPTPYLLHLISEGLPCSSILSGAGTRGCSRIVECSREQRMQVFYRCRRTGRLPLHEAALRCSCIHVIQALTAVHPGGTVEVDNSGDTPLHLLFAGVAKHNIDAETMGEIVDQLMQPLPSITAGIANGVGDLPLHFACAAPETMVPTVAIARLLAAAPRSSLLLNLKRQTPLHLHCQRRNASVEIAQQLIAAPEVPFRCSVDSLGYSELHYATLMCNTALIRHLLVADPFSACDRTTHEGRSALHLICLQHPGDDCLTAVEALLEAAPAMATRPDEQTLNTPLHLLLSNVRSSHNICFEIFQAIVRAAPDCLKSADHNNYLPLHHAAQVGADPAIIFAMLSAYPEAAFAVTRKRDTALSLACTANVSSETVRMLLEANAAATDASNDYGFLPIHCVCRERRPGLSIVQLLVEANPESVRRLTHAGETPIHLANGAGRAVLALLATAASEDVTHDNSNMLMANKIGNTPLHYACLRNATVESIEALAESNPNWILACNNAGYSPMQILCKNGRINDRIVTIFSRLCGSKVFSSVDACGNTPLHSVMREETNVEVLRALIHAYPDALHMRTLYEDTPLSLACLRKVHPDVMREVAHASYDGLDSSGTDGTHRLSPLVIRNRAGQTPIGIAMEEYRKASAEAPTRFCVTSDPTPEQTRAFNALSALVKILHYGPSKDGGRNESLVSACLLLHRNEVRLDPAFIRRALLVNPGEAKMVDKDLNYPLHVEASIPVEKMILLDAPHVPTTGCCCGGTCHKRVGVLQMLVEIYPDAAKHRNKDGDFPLNLMVCNGRPWDNTFAFVVRAYPEALHWVDNLSPKIAAHVLAKVSSGCGVDTLYSLVRARPAMLWSYEESS